MTTTRKPTAAKRTENLEKVAQDHGIRLIVEEGKSAWLDKRLKVVEDNLRLVAAVLMLVVAVLGIELVAAAVWFVNHV